MTKAKKNQESSSVSKKQCKRTPQNPVEHANSSKALWIPEEICDRRKCRGQLRYFIKWKGFDSSKNTWEPISNLAGHEDSVGEYERTWQLEYQAKSAEVAAQKAAKKIESTKKSVTVVQLQPGELEDSEYNEDDCDDEICSHGQRKGRRTRSNLWNCEILIPIRNKEGLLTQCKCNAPMGNDEICNQVINMTGGSNSTVWSHLLHTHRSLHTALKTGEVMFLFIDWILQLSNSMH